MIKPNWVSTTQCRWHAAIPHYKQTDGYLQKYEPTGAGCVARGASIDSSASSTNVEFEPESSQRQHRGPPS